MALDRRNLYCSRPCLIQLVFLPNRHKASALLGQDVHNIMWRFSKILAILSRAASWRTCVCDCCFSRSCALPTFDQVYVSLPNHMQLEVHTWA